MTKEEKLILIGMIFLIVEIVVLTLVLVQFK